MAAACLDPFDVRMDEPDMQYNPSYESSFKVRSPAADITSFVFWLLTLIPRYYLRHDFQILRYNIRGLT